jgi:rhodanese-related sulfurtransferase
VPVPTLDELPEALLDPEVEISPFALFRRLREGERPLLVDLRQHPGEVGLQGALPDPGPGWVPPAGRTTVLFDRDGSTAADRARRLRAAGYREVWALFGGIDLYALALDPEVVGEETFLVRGEG